MHLHIRPFYISSLGYGSFFDSFAEGVYALGVGGASTITHNYTTIDWYIFYGPTGDKIHQQYYKIIGAPKKVVIWGCGLIIWHNNYTGSDQVLSHNTGCIANQIPVTAQWVDRPYSDGAQGWGYMNFSAAFGGANPGPWIKQITSDTGYNVKEMTWVMPGTFGTPVPPAGTYWTGGNYYLDLSNPAAVTWYVKQLDSLQNRVGIQGHKMDRCDGDANPFPATWYDGTAASLQKWKYLYLNAKVTDSSLRKAWGDNQFNYARGAYHRCQPYLSAIWSGDIDAPWGGLVLTVSNSLKAAFMGFPMWGSDIGGYMEGATKIAKDQYLRWLTFGCFCGMMENMYDGKEPWTYTAATDTVAGQSFVSRYASVAQLRASLIPYVYSLVNTSADNGVSMRPLPYMYPNDANTYQIPDEYMFGPAFLVAPIVSATMNRSVYLPAGTWYISFPTDRTPIIPKRIRVAPPSPRRRFRSIRFRHTSWPTPYLLRARFIRVTPIDGSPPITIIRDTLKSMRFPDGSGENTSFTYVDYLDADTQKPLTCTVGPNSDSMVTVTVPAMTVPETLMVRMNSTPVSVVLNSAKLTTSQYGYNATTKRVTVPATQAANVLVINGPTSGLRERHDAPSLQGRLELVSSKSGMALLVPPIAGISPTSRTTAGIFDMSGRCLWQDRIANNLRSSTTVRLPLAGRGGVYLAVIKVDGIVLQRCKIVVP